MGRRISRFGHGRVPSLAMMTVRKFRHWRRHAGDPMSRYAVADATGRRFTQLPITSEAVRHALGEGAHP